MLGSNAMRIVVGRIVNVRKVEVVKNLRLPVRLGLGTLTTICWDGGYLKSAKGLFGMKLII
jgi:hypothetical protein